MKRMLVLSSMLLMLAGTTMADTLYLRDGGSVQGKFVGYENGQFLMELANGSLAKYLLRDVQRLEMEGRKAGEEPRYRRFPRRDASGPVTPAAPRWETAPPFDVRLQDQWIRSQVQIRKGQRVRVEASGTVTLEGRYVVPPEGQAIPRFTDKPLPNYDSGALIAVIGNEEDAPLIFIGRQREFVADRDGMLYFTVNHWETRNAGGAFRVTVSVDRGAGAPGDWKAAARKNEKVVNVPGNVAWVDTGIDLNYDAMLEIIAEGQITFRKNQLVGPDGDARFNNREVRYPINSSGVGALIAKIRYSNGRESEPRFIGERYVKQIGQGEYGRLYLGINDNNVTDNTGAFKVTIRW